MNENSLIKDIGRSYIVSSFIPAALFLTVAALIFRDFAPSFLIRRIIESDEYYAGQLFLSILLTTWVGFALYSGWNSTVRLFEGYYFPGWMKRKFRDNLLEVYRAKSSLVDEYRILSHISNPSSEQLSRMDKLEPLLIAAYQELEMNFPVNGEFLPTRLGNILRASERYPFDRYKIEAITIFPRLVHLFPAEFRNQLEESNNKFIFLLNSSLLAYVTGSIALLVSILRSPCFWLNEHALREGFLSGFGKFACTFDPPPANFFQAGFRHLTDGKYFMIGLLFLVFGYFLYRVAAIMARAYANLIRSGYDLYRYELLKDMKIPLPENFSEETTLWYNLTNFLNNGGDFSPYPVVPDFKPKGEKETPSSPASGKLEVVFFKKIEEKRNIRGR